MQILRCEVNISLYIFAFFIALVFLPFESFASDTCQWIDSSGEASAENRTPDETKHFAINLARLSAIEEKTGVKIASVTLLKDFVLMADIIQTMAQGYIIEEKIAAWEATIAQKTKESFPLITYKVKLKACVAGSGEKDAYFTITPKLNKEVFVSGEEAKIKIKATRNCYINIFNMTADDRIKIVAPTKMLPLSPVKENEEITFPPEGFGLRMDMVPDKKRSTEFFIVVATKQPFNFVSLIGKIEDITIPEFYKAIVSIPSGEMAEALLPYEVLAPRR